ncbi:hypothetical protein KAI78_00820 [bacterium]|nr:hypothetical protein [bacterium]
MINILFFAITLILYNFALFVFFLISFPLCCIFLFNSRTRDYFNRFSMPRLTGSTLVHGASVGEHSGTLPLKDRFNEPVFSVNTSTGLKKLRGNGVQAIFMPWDLLPLSLILASRFRQLFYTESELNPNLIFLAYLLGKKQCILNLRFSEKKMKYYQMASFFYRRLFNFLNASFTKDVYEQAKAERLRIRSSVIGNTKYTGLCLSKKDLRRDVLLFASTHLSDEEMISRFLSKEFLAGKIVIIAPRHIGRCPEVFKRFASFSPEIFKDPEKLRSSTLYIVTTMGRLNDLYPRSYITFIGGSFKQEVGGHNPVEPASFGSKVLMGPDYGNFRSEVSILKKHGILNIVRDFTEVNFSDAPISRDNYSKALEELSPSETGLSKLFSV